MTETLKERIKRHEGLELVAYPDAGGWAIGYGHNLKYPVPKEAVEIIFEDDFANKAVKGFYSLPMEIRNGLSDARREVLIEMIFQLGLNGVLNFKRMCKALIAKDYEAAAVEIMDSDAGRKYPKRFQEYADAMRQG